MRRPLVVLAAGFLGLLTLGAFVSWTGAADPARGALPSATPPDPSVERKLQRLERELRRLEQDRRVTLASTRAEEEALPPTKPAGGPAARLEPSRSRDDAEQQERAADAHFEALEAHFQAEARDGAWARDVEGAVSRKSEDARFSAFSITRTRCASTLCKLEASAKSAGDDVTVDDLFQVVPRDLIGGAAVRRFGEPLGSQVVVYYARKGHRLPETD
jgi:hypothetical protein